MNPAFGIVVAVVYLIQLGLFGDWILALVDGNDWALIGILVTLGVPAMWVALKVDKLMKRALRWLFEEDL